MKNVLALEAEWASACGVFDTVACSSGTTAILLGLEALRLPPGSEVIVPAYTMVACARAVSMAGLTPVFADCGRDLLIDPDMAEVAASGVKARVVMPVHVFGRRCRMSRLVEIARGRDLVILEDLAEAHGVEPHPSTDVAAYSFYRNKIVASKSEGGMVAFRDQAAADLARSLRCLGFTEAHDYVHTPRGINGRLADSLAAEVLVSLDAYQANLAARREAERWYDDECPGGWRMPRRDAPWVYDLRIPGLTRERQSRVVRGLNSEGVAARMGFWPLHLQEEYRGCRVVGGAESLAAAEEVFYLPLQPGSVTRESAKLAFEVIRGLASPAR